MIEDSPTSYNFYPQVIKTDMQSQTAFEKTCSDISPFHFNPVYP
jgi:hypothetical protein